MHRQSLTRSASDRNHNPCETEGQPRRLLKTSECCQIQLSTAAGTCSHLSVFEGSAGVQHRHAHSSWPPGDTSLIKALSKFSRIAQGPGSKWNPAHFSAVVCCAELMPSKPHTLGPASGW